MGPPLETPAPGGVPPPTAAPPPLAARAPAGYSTPTDVYSGRNLHLGLGLNPAQREAFRAAAAGGTLSDFAGTLHGGQERRLQRLLGGGGTEGQRELMGRYEGGQMATPDYATREGRVFRENEARALSPIASQETLARVSNRPGLFRGGQAEDRLRRTMGRGGFRR